MQFVTQAVLGRPEIAVIARAAASIGAAFPGGEPCRTLASLSAGPASLQRIRECRDALAALQAACARPVPAPAPVSASAGQAGLIASPQAAHEGWTAVRALQAREAAAAVAVLDAALAGIRARDSQAKGDTPGS